MKGANLTTVEMLTALGSRCNAKELKAEQKSKKNPWRTEQLCLHLHLLKQEAAKRGFLHCNKFWERWPETDQFNVEQNRLLKFFTVFPKRKTQWINKLNNSSGLEWLKIHGCSSLCYLHVGLMSHVFAYKYEYCTLVIKLINVKVKIGLSGCCFQQI